MFRSIVRRIRKMWTATIFSLIKTVLWSFSSYVWHVLRRLQLMWLLNKKKLKKPSCFFSNFVCSDVNDSLLNGFSPSQSACQRKYVIIRTLDSHLRPLRAGHFKKSQLVCYRNWFMYRTGADLNNTPHSLRGSQYFWIIRRSKSAYFLKSCRLNCCWQAGV